MFNNIKVVVVVSFAFFALLMTNVTVVAAQTFNDVATDTWYFDYVEQLVDDGVIDADDTYRPNDAVTRGELVTIVIEAIDGLSGFEAPEAPTFSDVQVDSDYYDYIEAAAWLNIFGGYRDAEGNRTGVFGYNDTVTRAATTKIIISAFNISTDTDSGSSFPDVTEDAWFYDYVVTAYNHSLINGYENGSFGPADPLTRAQIAKIIVNAKSLAESVDSTDDEAEEVNKSKNEGKLEIALNDYQSPLLTVPLATATILVNLDLTAVDADVQVTEITLTRSGVGNASDWSAIYIYEGNFKITSEYSINRDTNKVTLPVDLHIEGGKTTTITFYGDTDVFATPVNQHYFSIASAADIVSNSQSVTGNFPATGNVITIGSVYANTTTITPGSTPSRPKRDVQSEIAAFKLEAGNSSDVALNAIILTQGGSFSSSKMLDCNLLNNNDVIATADGFYEDQLIFGLKTPYIIPKGQTRKFYVHCYIDGGRTTDSIQLYLEEIYDLLTTDLDFGFPAGALNGYTQSLAPILFLRPVRIFIQ